jgi:hypothetical protein
MSRVIVMMIVLSLTGCAQQQAPQQANPHAPFKVVANVHELMEGMVAPAAEAVFEAVATIISEKGMEEIQPRTDEEWEEVEHRALALAESANLLMFEERIPDQGRWVEFSEDMMEKALVAAKAAESKDKDGLFDAAGRVYETCLACHMEYIKDDQQPSAQ